MTRAVLGLVTCGSKPEARRLATALLNARAAACVNVVAGVESHYWWEGRRTTSRECLLLIKTTPARRSLVERTVRATHSYAVPEIVFVAIQSGERRYLDWLRRAVRPGAKRKGV